MAKVFLTLKSWAKSKNTPISVKLLESQNIPFEKLGTTIYLISKESYITGVDIISREYNKLHSKFCMQLSDSTLGGSISMGEDSLDDKVFSVLHKVFGNTLYFEFTLSCNSNIENKSAKIEFNRKNKSFDFEAVIEDDNNFNDEEEYIDCIRCGNSHLVDTECPCAKIASKIVNPPAKFIEEVKKIRALCKKMEEKDVSYTEWAAYFISKGYKANLDIDLEISINKNKFIITNKNNKLPLEINFIEGRFAGWLAKK